MGILTNAMNYWPTAKCVDGIMEILIDKIIWYQKLL